MDLIESCEHYSVQGDCGGRRQSASCCPCGALLIQTQRSCRKELDARANTDVLHHPSTESNGGVCQSQCIPASARLCYPSSWLRRWDVSHRRHITPAAQHEKRRHHCSPGKHRRGGLGDGDCCGNHKAKARNSCHAKLILTSGLNQIMQTLS